MNADLQRTNAASTGLTGTKGAFLDAHFAACRAEYEAMLRSVGIQPGWHVLDAACGSGAYLLLLAELVGPSGAITAFDLAPDNVTRVQQLVQDQPLGCPVEVRVASLTDLPYPDAAFDAVWCANSLEYLADADVPVALAEFQRVLRPGGVVATKEPDPGLWLFAPGDPMLLLRMWAAVSTISSPFHGTLRARMTRRFLERAGFTAVWQRATLSEIWAPVQPIQRHYIGRQLMQMGALAEQARMSRSDLAFWRQQRDPDASEALVNNPDLFWCEGHFVAVGQVSEGSE
jgi:ubiquinone/menaquinone biosynthesis C-methylase UbiE